MPLSPLDEGLWHAEGDHWMPGGMWFPVRMVVARLADGTLWLHAPIGVDDALAAEIDALGPVSAIVAPNLLHDRYLRDATLRWPDAVLWAPPGLADRHPELTVHHTLGFDPAPWADRLRPEPLDGADRVSETLFLHEPTATLILTDAAFHVHDAPTFKTRWMLKVVGAWQRLAMSRSWVLFRTDRAAFRESLDRLARLAPSRIVPAHGRVIEQDATVRWREALARYRGTTAV